MRPDHVEAIITGFALIGGGAVVSVLAVMWSLGILFNRRN
jgi:hypothetical protein